MTKADLLASGLDDFLAVSPDVEAAAVVSVDGLPMASALPPYVEEDRLAAMSAALLTLGERAATGLGKGDLAQVFVEAAQGYVVLMAAGRNALLVAVTSGSAKVGLVLFEMRKIASRVAEIMDSDAPSETHADATSEIPDPVADFGDVPAAPVRNGAFSPASHEETETVPEGDSRSFADGDDRAESAISTWH